MSTLRKFHIPLPGALLVLLAFFLPWVTVSCQGVEYAKLSGYDLAQTGTDNLVLLWALPAVAVLSILLVLVTMRRPEDEQKTAAGHIIAAVIALAAFAYIWYENIPSSGESLYEYDTEYGSWLTVAGLGIIILGGILSFLEARRGGSHQMTDYGGYTYDDAPLPLPNLAPAGGTTMSATTDLAGGRPTDFPAMSPLTAPGATVSGAPSPSPHRATEVINRAPEALAWLVMREGVRAGQTFRVSENTNIGRDAANDIIIDDTSLSGQHAKIKLEDGNHFMLYDLASTNGVFVYDAAKSDWERVYRVELSDGQQIKLGRSVLSFMHLSPDKAAKA